MALRNGTGDGTTVIHNSISLEDMPQNIRRIKERIRLLSENMEKDIKSSKL